MDIDVLERAIKSSLELAEALEEYNRCVAELTYYLKASGRHRDTDA